MTKQTNFLKEKHVFEKQEIMKANLWNVRFFGKQDAANLIKSRPGENFRGLEN